MRPALWAAGAIATGILLAELVRPHPLLVLGLLIPLIVIAGARWRGWGALICVAVAWGVLFYAWSQTAGRGNLLAWVGQTVEVVGTVSTEPIVQKGGGLSYTVEVERIGGAPARGKLSVLVWPSRSGGSTNGGSAATSGLGEPSGPTPGYGERVRLTGRLERPLGPRTPGGFDQAAYLGRQGIDLTVKPKQVERLGPGDLSAFRRWSVQCRLRLEERLRAALPPRDAALLSGLLFGTRSDLPADIKQAFQESGVVHLLAVSGGNVAMILLPFIWFLRRLGVRPRWAGAAGIPLVWFFVFLTGAGPSVMRAGLMATLVLLGDLLQRERNALNTLGAAAAILLLLDPRLLFDIGFQLSAVATLGILLFARRIQAWLASRFQTIWGEWLGQALAAGLSVTVAAQLVVEPISLYHFGTLAPIAPIANLIVGLFLEPLVWLGTAVALIGLGLPVLAWVLAWPVRWGLWLLVFLMKATAAVPGGYLEPGRLPLPWVLLWYVVLALAASPALRAWLWAWLCWLAGRPVPNPDDSPGPPPETTNGEGSPGAHVALPWSPPHRRRPAVLLVLLPVVLLLPIGWRLLLPGRPADELRLTALDVGQGDALLLELPGGRTMLIDGGPAMAATADRDGYDAGETVLLPALRERGIRHLDWVVMTHPHQDHGGGLPTVLRALPVGLFLENGMTGTAPGPAEAKQVAAEKGVPIVKVQEEEAMDLGGGVTAQILSPPAQLFQNTRSDENANSIVLLVTYGSTRLLLTGDLEAVGEEWLLAKGIDLRADVLKVAHHGSRYSSTAAFLAAVQPRVAMISMGRGNLFGHPDPGTVKRLQAAGAAVYRTDQDGPITFRTRGADGQVSTAQRRRPAGVVGLLGRPLIGAW